MRSITLDVNKPQSVVKAAEQAAKVLQNGGVVVYPTDTAYGLGANALNPEAVERIFRIKERGKQQALPVAVKGIAMAHQLAVISPVEERFLAHVWPGPVTVILQKRSLLPDVLTDSGPIGVRIPKHAFHEALFVQIDFPITATSANISGENAVYNMEDLKRQLQDKKCLPDLIIDAGVLPAIPPSTVIDLSGKEPKILRIGPVRSEELFTLFRECERSIAQNFTDDDQRN